MSIAVDPLVILLVLTGVVIYLLAFLYAWVVGATERRGLSPFTGIFLMVLGQNELLKNRRPDTYENPSDAFAAASKLEELGDWDEALELLAFSAKRWPEHAEYARMCQAEIHQKMKLGNRYSIAASPGIHAKSVQAEPERSNPYQDNDRRGLTTFQSVLSATLLIGLGIAAFVYPVHWRLPLPLAMLFGPYLAFRLQLVGAELVVLFCLSFIAPIHFQKNTVTKILAAIGIFFWLYCGFRLGSWTYA